MQTFQSANSSLSSWPLLLSRFQCLNSYAPRITSHHSLMLLSSVCSSLSTFISRTVLPSIHLFSSSGGELWGSPLPKAGPVWRRIIWRLWTGLCNSLGALCYLFPVSVCVCVCDQGVRSPWSSLKIPTLSHKVPVHRTDERLRKRETPGRTCDKTPSSP